MYKGPNIRTKNNNPATLCPNHRTIASNDPPAFWQSKPAGTNLEPASMSTSVNSIKDKLFCGLQYLLPQHLLSRLGAGLAESKLPWLKNFLIRIFSKKFQVNMNEAYDQNLDAYPCFNDFFTRALKPDARPIATDANVLISPADGTISQCGAITDGQLIQAKGLSYLASDLIDDKAIALQFQCGKFITTYLSPGDYHRVHMPLSGRLLHSQYIPGKLFSVNTARASLIPELFARNERLVCVFESQQRSICTCHGRSDDGRRY